MTPYTIPPFTRRPKVRTGLHWPRPLGWRNSASVPAAVGWVDQVRAAMRTLRAQCAERQIGEAVGVVVWYFGIAATAYLMFAI